MHQTVLIGYLRRNREIVDFSFAYLYANIIFVLQYKFIVFILEK